MRREDRSPSSSSSSRRPRRVDSLGHRIASPHLIAVPLFVPGGRSFVPTCACKRAARKGPSRLAVGRALPLASVLPGHALTAPSTARGSRWRGRSIGLVAPEGAPLVENRPRDAGELVGQRNGEHVVVESLLRRLDPRFEPIAFPMLWPELDQQDPGRLNEQGAQIAIAAPRYATSGSVSRRYLLRDQPEPGAEV